MGIGAYKAVQQLAPWTQQQDLAQAKAFRTTLNSFAPPPTDPRLNYDDPSCRDPSVCAICTRITALRDMHAPITTTDTLDILRADFDNPSKEVPRDARTVTVIDGRQYLLLPRSVALTRDNKLKETTACSECASSLLARQPRVPPSALARLDPGPWPTPGGNPLPRLTLFEAQILAPLRACLNVVICRPEGGDAWRERNRAIMGHGVAFPNPTTEQFLTAIPLPPSELPNVVSVIYLCKVESSAHLRHLLRNTPAIQIRIPVILAWLEHYLRATHGQVCVSANDHAITTWRNMLGAGGAAADEAVMQAMEAATIHANTEEEAEALRTAYQTADPTTTRSRMGGQNDTLGATSNTQAEEERIAAAQEREMTHGLEHMVMHTNTTDPLMALHKIAKLAKDIFSITKSDTAARLANKLAKQAVLMNDEAARQQAQLQAELQQQNRQRLMRGDNVVIVAPKSQPFSSYDPRYLSLCCITAFPNGPVALPKNMSLQRGLQTLLLRQPREQYAHNLTLVLLGYDTMHRHRIHTQSRVQIRLQPHLAERVPQELMQADLDAVWELHNSDARGNTLQAKLANMSTLAQQLYHSFTSSAARVPGSAAAERRARMGAYALWYTHNCYTLFITFNPPAAHSDLFFSIAGQRHGWSSEELATSLGVPDLDMSISQRWAAAVADPVAQAQFARAFVLCFAQEMCGFDLQKQRQTNPACVLGAVSALLFRAEETEAANIHYHGLIAQPGVQPADLVAILADPSRQAAYVAWTRRFCYMFLPGGHVSKRVPVADNDYSTLPNDQPASNKQPTWSEIVAGQSATTIDATTAASNVRKIKEAMEAATQASAALQLAAHASDEMRAAGQEQEANDALATAKKLSESAVQQLRSVATYSKEALNIAKAAFSDATNSSVSGAPQAHAGHGEKADSLAEALAAASAAAYAWAANAGVVPQRLQLEGHKHALVLEAINVRPLTCRADLDHADEAIFMAAAAADSVQARHLKLALLPPHPLHKTRTSCTLPTFPALAARPQRACHTAPRTGPLQNALLHLRLPRHRRDVPPAHATPAGHAAARVDHKAPANAHRRHHAATAPGPRLQLRVAVHSGAHDGQPLQHEQPAHLRGLRVLARTGHREPCTQGQAQLTGAPRPRPAARPTATNNTTRTRPAPAALTDTPQLPRERGTLPRPGRNLRKHEAPPGTSKKNTAHAKKRTNHTERIKRTERLKSNLRHKHERRRGRKPKPRTGQRHTDHAARRAGPPPQQISGPPCRRRRSKTRPCWTWRSWRT